MGRAKDIQVRVIKAADANRISRALHYSGKVVQNSTLHLGVFLDGKCGGVMQFGASIDKRKTQALVEGTLWNDFIELNRMAFAEWLPPNSESRALGYALRFIRKTYPNIAWVISYADACQCGDGTIYRASGFVLTGVKKNTTMMRLPDGRIVADKTLDNDSVYGSKYWRERGATRLEGYQIRYIKFLRPGFRERLTVPELPYTRITELGAGMYRGEKTSARSDTSDTPGDQSGEGGAAPTLALSPNGGGDA